MIRRIQETIHRNARRSLLVLTACASLASAAAAETRQTIDVAALLPRLPVEVFDSTTEGIEADELTVLRTRGQSEYWRIARRTPGKVVFAAKRPFSEINLRPVRDGGAVFVEALTFNEKAISYSYWIAAGPTGPLQVHRPSAVFRLLNEREDGKPGIAEKDAPAAIVDHVKTRERCAKLGSQSAAGGGECEKLAAKASQLRQQFSGQPRWTEVIERIGKVVGD